MDATHGAAAAALTTLSQHIREYSVYQAVPLILGVLREVHPDADDEQLHAFLELRANPSLGFPCVSSEKVHFFGEEPGWSACIYWLRLLKKRLFQTFPVAT